MQLRDHPLLCRDGMANWPPVWTRSRTYNAKSVTGEIGRLKYVYANCRASNKIFLVIDYQQETYVGSLISENRAVAIRISEFLQKQIGRSIGDIGALDLPA